jgi:hypothetical protein
MHRLLEERRLVYRLPRYRLAAISSNSRLRAPAHFAYKPSLRFVLLS